MNGESVIDYANLLHQSQQEVIQSLIALNERIAGILQESLPEEITTSDIPDDTFCPLGKQLRVLLHEQHYIQKLINSITARIQL